MPDDITFIADIVVDADCWAGEPDAEAIVQRAIASAAAKTGVSTSGGEVAIMLTDDAAIRTLNRDWRALDKPTNVLSFPAAEQGGGDGPRMLGDIAIAYETVRREASDEGKTFANHLSHLAIHGFLHLIGHDHENDDEAEAMESLERDILAALGIPDPY